MCIEESWTINQWHHSWIIINYNALMSPWLDGVITASPYFQHGRTHGALEHLVSTGFRSRQYPHSMDKPLTTHEAKLSRILVIQIAIGLLLHRCDLFLCTCTKIVNILSHRFTPFVTFDISTIAHVGHGHGIARAMPNPSLCRCTGKMELWLNAWIVSSNSSLFLSQSKVPPVIFTTCHEGGQHKILQSAVAI